MNIDIFKTSKIIVEPNFLNSKLTSRIITLLSGVKAYNDDFTYLLFTDNDSLLFDNTINSTSFPSFLEYIKKEVQNWTKSEFNSCLVKKVDKGERITEENDSDIFEWLVDSSIHCDIIPSISLGSSKRLELTRKTGKSSISKSPSCKSTKSKKKYVYLENGTLTVQKTEFQKYWKYRIIDCLENEEEDVFYNLIFINIPCSKIEIPLHLKSIYIKNRYRLALSTRIRKELSEIHIKLNSICNMEDGSDDSLSEYVHLNKLIGTGDWGNVYSGQLSNKRNDKNKHTFQQPFAIKFSRISDEDFKNPYTKNSSSWYEIVIMRDILKPLIEKNICPNVPLFIDNFLCETFDFKFRKGDNSYPCIATITELASEDLKDYINNSEYVSDKELYSVLFQIMAGIHAFQMRGQILNNDIKARNILCYDVEEGGYWHYIINKRDFYVPNYGKMFVLNDFGVSNLYDPNFKIYPTKTRKVFNLGSRYAININEQFHPINSVKDVENYRIEWINKPVNLKKDEMIEKGKIVPIEISNGLLFYIDRETDKIKTHQIALTTKQKEFLQTKGIPTDCTDIEFFKNPYIIPPFEFYNDVQDVLRMFTKGKRTTQRGFHSGFKNISSSFVKSIVPYLGKAENSSSKIFSYHTHHVLAGSFITRFFKDSCNYGKKPMTGKCISVFDMDKIS